MILRLPALDAAIEHAAKYAAKLCNTPLTISYATEETDAAFAKRLPQFAKQVEFLGTIETPSDEILHTAYEADLNWIQAPISTQGRIELTRWLREQSISETRHRYGNLMGKFGKR